MLFCHDMSWETTKYHLKPNTRSWNTVSNVKHWNKKRLGTLNGLVSRMFCDLLVEYRLPLRFTRCRVLLLNSCQLSKVQNGSQTQKPTLCSEPIPTPTIACLLCTFNIHCQHISLCSACNFLKTCYMCKILTSAVFLDTETLTSAGMGRFCTISFGIFKSNEQRPFLGLLCVANHLLMTAIDRRPMT